MLTTSLSTPARRFHSRNRNIKDHPKPKKPRPDFPLYSHRNGQWAKKIRGKTHFFGKWNDPQAAPGEYLRIKDDLQAGRTPTPAAGVVIALADVVNAYLADADQRKETGDLSPVSFADYQFTGRWIVKHFGRAVDPQQLRPADFAAFRHVLAAKYAPTRAGKMVTVTRMILRWAYESELIDTLPRFGPGFKATSKWAARAAKAERGEKLFTAAEVLRMLDETDGTFAALILLAINTGFGNSDLSALPLKSVDIEGGLINFPRPKTGGARRVPLWPETIAALRDVIDNRPEPQSDALADRLFLTSRGGEWVAVTNDGRRVDKITIRFRKLLRSIDAYQAGRGFYTLRHTLQTVGDDAGDPLATSHIMGHVDSSTAGHYRERISDERLRKVTDHVHQWLFRESEAKPKRSTKAKRSRRIKREPADNPAGEGKPSLRVVG